MAPVPESIAAFLAGRRLAVTGVSRKGDVPANGIFRRLRDCGYEVLPVNPAASEVEGTRCYPSVRALPGTIDGVMIASPPQSGLEIVAQCAERGIQRVWFHRSIGDGSVSPEAVRECETRGIRPIVGGCPLMFCGRVDIFHKCMCWWLQRRGRVPR
jgi:predicted CoA-binding protein